MGERSTALAPQPPDYASDIYIVGDRLVLQPGSHAPQPTAGPEAVQADVAGTVSVEGVPSTGRHANAGANAVSVAELLRRNERTTPAGSTVEPVETGRPSPRPRPVRPVSAPAATPEKKPQPNLRERVKNWTDMKKLGTVALGTAGVLLTGSFMASAKHEADERAALEQRVGASSQIPDRLPDSPDDNVPDLSPMMVTFNVWETDIRDTVLDERIAVPHTVGEETHAFNYLQEPPQPDAPSRAGLLTAYMSFTTAGNPSYDSDAERKSLADPASFKGAEGQGLVPLTAEARTVLATEINQQIDKGELDAPRIDPLRNDPRDNLVMAGRWMNKLALEAITAAPDRALTDRDVFIHVVHKMGNGEYSEAFKNNVAVLSAALNAPGQPDAAKIYHEMLVNPVLNERAVKATLAQTALGKIEIVAKESDS